MARLALNFDKRPIGKTQ